MVVSCQSCGAENDDEARFCDQCGTVLAGALASDSLPASVNSSPVRRGQEVVPEKLVSSQVNWFGIGVLALVLTAVIWLVFGEGDKQPAGSSASQQSPEDIMANAQKSLEEAKAKLESDPADLQALSTMYQLYGQIGQSDKVKPYAENALSIIRTGIESDSLDMAAGRKSVLDVAMAAMSGDDPLTALSAMAYYYELTPERVSTALMIANIYYDIGMPKESLEWYDRYLKDADPGQEGTAYLGAEVDRETMRMTIAEQESRPELLDEAVNVLMGLAKQNPDFWAAQFNLGQAYLKQGKKDNAIAQWQVALKLASSPEEKWRSEAAIAEAEGRPAPALPTGSDFGTGGVSPIDPSHNPHATPASPPEQGSGNVDPHAGLGF
jgi:tetratricopeptide (TPR) repeat protein